jgi:hypothetical protein
MEQNSVQHPDNWRKKIVTQSFSRFPEKRQSAERDIWIDGVNFGAIEKHVEYEGKFKQADTAIAALQAKCERYEAALREAKESINWMWQHMKEPDGQTLLRVDEFNRPANALYIIDEALSARDGEKEVENGE